MITINKTNFEVFENIIIDIVRWLEYKNWVNWETGKIDCGCLTETNAIACYKALDYNEQISTNDFVELFININSYSEQINDLSIDL